jgi:hypothetical protein
MTPDKRYVWELLYHKLRSRASTADQVLKFAYQGIAINFLMDDTYHQRSNIESVLLAMRRKYAIAFVLEPSTVSFGNSFCVVRNVELQLAL